MNEGKIGRTFWDYCDDNPKKVVMAIVILLLILVFLITNGYEFKSNSISISPSTKKDSVVNSSSGGNRSEEVKRKDRNIDKPTEENKSKKYNIKNNSFFAPTQIGDHNIQNINNGPLQRIANDSIVNVITTQIPDKNSILIFDRQNKENETNNFAKSLVTALKLKGYNNSSISFEEVWGGDNVYFDDEERTLRELKYFLFAEKSDGIHIRIPLR
jgi:spore germination protein YaaH